MVEIILFRATVGASAVESTIGDIVCPEKEQITVLELWAYAAGAGVVKGFFKQRKVDEMDKVSMAGVADRVVKNLVMVAGDKYEFKGTDESAAPNKMVVGLVIDRITTA
jgi:hypothetical protein